MRKKLSIGVLSLHLLYLLIINHAYSAPQIQEYHVKATFTQTFSNFIKWPKHTFSSKQQSLQICIIGENPFGQTLEILVRKHNANITAESNPQAVRYLHRSENLNHCHLVYFNDSEESYFYQTLNKLKGKPVLTVSSIKDFAINGGMIQFYVRNNRVRFLVDLQSIRESQLQANANFLRVANIISE